MSGKFGIHSLRGYPKITNRSIGGSKGIGNEYGLGFDRRGLVFTYRDLGADLTEYWPQWAGFPSPGLATVGDPYEIRLVVVSGLAPSSGDVVNTFIDLVSNRQWGNVLVAGLNTSVWRIDLRRAFAGSGLIASALYTFSITGV